MTMKLYHMNTEAMSRDDAFEAMMGTRNREGVELYKRLMAAGVYVLVAEIDGEDLEHAWAASQNGLHRDSWSLDSEDGVRPVSLGELGHRSSMVGDIVVLNDNMHVADMIGFVEIGPVLEVEAPRP